MPKENQGMSMSVDNTLVQPVSPASPDAPTGPATVLFISGSPGAPQRYRCEHHIEQLATVGITGVLHSPDNPAILLAIANARLIVLHRVAFTPLVSELFTVASLAQTPVVFDTDDLIFDPAADGEMRIFDRYTSSEKFQFRDSLARNRETVARCQGMLVTTSTLHAAATRCGFEAAVHRNGFSLAMKRVADDALAQREKIVPLDSTAARRGRNLATRCILGYLCGSASHDADFATIAPAILNILERHPLVTLRIVGPLALSAEFQKYGPQIKRVAFRPWQELPQELGKIDINLAPLEIANRFCQGKSEIKYIEAALVKVVTIASPTEAFQHAIRHGERGLLADGVEEWERGLAELIMSPDKRQQMAQAAHSHVLSAYAPDVMGPQLQQTLGKWLDRVEALAEPIPHDRRDAALHLAHQRVSNHIQELQTRLAQQANQLDSVRYLIRHLPQLIARRIRSKVSRMIGTDRSKGD